MLRKILIVIPAYAPDFRNGGSVTGCRSFASTLKSAGFKITIVTLDTLNDGIEFRLIDGIEVYYLRRSPFFDFISKSGWGLSLQYLFWMNQNVKNYDLIYFRSLWNFVSLFGPVLCFWKKAKYAFCSSGKLSKHAMINSNIKKKTAGFIFGHFFSKAIFVHYASQQEYEEQSLSFFEEVPPVILPPKVSVPIKSQKSSINEEIITIYTVSRVDVIKNLEYVFKEVADILTSEKNVRFIFFGGGDQELLKSLVKIFTKNNININFSLPEDEISSPGVYIFGHTVRSDVDHIIGDPSIFVQMSHSEGLSNAVLEACARGSDVVVSPGCRMREIADIGVISEIESKPKELYKFLSSRTMSRQSIIQSGNKARKFVEKRHNEFALGESFIKQISRLLP